MTTVRAGGVPLGECFRFPAGTSHNIYMRLATSEGSGLVYCTLGKPQGLYYKPGPAAYAVPVEPMVVGFRVTGRAGVCAVQDFSRSRRCYVALPDAEDWVGLLLAGRGEGGGLECMLGEDSAVGGYGRGIVSLQSGKLQARLRPGDRVVLVTLRFQVLAQGERAARAWGVETLEEAALRRSAVQPALGHR